MTMPSAPDWYYTKPDNVKRRTGAGGVVARLADDKVLIALIRDHGDHEYVLPKGGVEHGKRWSKPLFARSKKRPVSTNSNYWAN